MFHVSCTVRLKNEQICLKEKYDFKKLANFFCKGCKSMHTSKPKYDSILTPGFLLFESISIPHLDLGIL